MTRQNYQNYQKRKQVWTQLAIGATVATIVTFIMSVTLMHAPLFFVSLLFFECSIITVIERQQQPYKRHQTARTETIAPIDAVVDVPGAVKVKNGLIHYLTK